MSSLKKPAVKKEDTTTPVKATVTRQLRNKLIKNPVDQDKKKESPRKTRQATPHKVKSEKDKDDKGDTSEEEVKHVERDESSVQQRDKVSDEEEEAGQGEGGQHAVQSTPAAEPKYHINNQEDTTPIAASRVEEDATKSREAKIIPTPTEVQAEESNKRQTLIKKRYEQQWEEEERLKELITQREKQRRLKVQKRIEDTYERSMMEECTRQSTSQRKPGLNDYPSLALVPVKVESDEEVEDVVSYEEKVHLKEELTKVKASLADRETELEKLQEHYAQALIDHQYTSGAATAPETPRQATQNDICIDELAIQLEKAITDVGEQQKLVRMACEAFDAAVYTLNNQPREKEEKLEREKKAEAERADAAEKKLAELHEKFEAKESDYEERVKKAVAAKISELRDRSRRKKAAQESSSSSKLPAPRMEPFQGKPLSTVDPLTPAPATRVSDSPMTELDTPARDTTFTQTIVNLPNADYEQAEREEQIEIEPNVPAENDETEPNVPAENDETEPNIPRENDENDENGEKYENKETNESYERDENGRNYDPEYVENGENVENDENPDNSRKRKRAKFLFYSEKVHPNSTPGLFILTPLADEAEPQPQPKPETTTEATGAPEEAAEPEKKRPFIARLFSPIVNPAGVLFSAAASGLALCSAAAYSELMRH